MKKIIITSILFITLFIASDILLAQGPPQPPGNPDLGGGPVGGSAALTGGVGILLALGAAYGGRKLYKAWKDKEEIEE
jgi:hypothetical protein